MATHTIQSSQLTPGAIVIVDGVVAYSRLATLISGEELARDKQRKQRMGIPVVESDYVTIQINNAAIVPVKPGQMTPDEIYVQEMFFTSKDPDGGYSFSRNHIVRPNSNRLPTYGEGSDPNCSQVKILPKLEGELAKGLPVRLVLKIFKPKNFANMGVGLQSVFSRGPIRYYESDMSASLAAYGMTIESPQQDGETMSMEQAMAQPVGDPVGNAFANNPAATTPAQTPPQPAPPQAATMPNAPVPAAMWQCGCSNFNPQTSKFCAACGAPNPAAAAVQMGGNNPYAQAAPPPAGPAGISYDPNTRNY